MFIYDKRLQYPVKIDKPNPRLASIIISQYGGPDGELGASLRYLSQRYSMPFDEANGTKCFTEDSGRVSGETVFGCCYNSSIGSCGVTLPNRTSFGIHP